jgi:3-phosphoshikimate 1-carboxyvinyltransferase
MVNVAPDPAEPCNRTLTVYGKAGEVPRGGTAEQPMELFVANAGTAARFLAAFVCLGQGVYRLDGTPRMRERPQAELFSALRQLGYVVSAEQGDEKLPAKILGNAPGSGIQPRCATPVGQSSGSWKRSCSVSIESSSQFASALLLCAGTGNWSVEILGENAEESPYVAMTSELIKAFPRKGGVFHVEPDASSGAYFLAAEKLLPPDERLEYSEQFGVSVPTRRMHTITVKNWPRSGWQMDQGFLEVLLRTGLDVSIELERKGQRAKQISKEQFRKLAQQTLPPSVISRTDDLGDSIMMAIALAPFSMNQVLFKDLGRLRLQECERVVALRSELTKCGAWVVEEADTLTVYPSELHGAEIETYDDHRMAMCFAILGLKVPGIKIKNPSCVKKTFPNFFQKLAAPPPRGLGARILDARNGRELSGDELFAH